MSPASCVRQPLAQFRLAIRLARQFHRSALRAAKATNREPLSRKVAPTKPSPLRRSEGRQTPRSVDNNLETEQFKMRWYATNLYNNGQTKIYRAPSSHLGLFSASYVIGASCIFTAGVTAFINQDVYNPNGELHWVVTVGTRLVIIVFTIVGGFALIQPLNMVRSIDLVKKNDTVKLLVQVRRPLAFLRPKGHIIDPFNLKVKRTYTMPLPLPFESFEEPQSAQPSKSPTNPFSYIAQAISKGIYYPFLSVRKLMTSDGVMSISLVEGEKTTRCKLDTTGRFSNNGQDFHKMSVFDLDR